MVGTKDSRAAMNMQQTKRRIVKMLVVVATVFALSWLPLYSMKLRIMFGPKPSETEEAVLSVLFQFAQWLGSSNCCVNPFIYCCFSQMYRDNMRALLFGKRAPEAVNERLRNGSNQRPGNPLAATVKCPYAPVIAL